VVPPTWLLGQPKRSAMSLSTIAIATASRIPDTPPSKPPIATPTYAPTTTLTMGISIIAARMMEAIALSSMGLPL
jgi:hypothetical protein